MNADVPPVECTKCNGERLVANTDDQEPWSAWANLPAGSDLAVRVGMVKPMACPACIPHAADVVPGFLVAYDPADKFRAQWEGTDVAFAERGRAEEVLAQRLRTWPELPFRVYALVPLPGPVVAGAQC